MPNTMTNPRTAYLRNFSALRANAAMVHAPDMTVADLTSPAHGAAVAVLQWRCGRRDSLAMRRTGRILAAADLRALGDHGMPDVFPCAPAAVLDRVDP